MAQTSLYHYGHTILPQYKATRLVCQVTDLSLDSLIAVVYETRNIDLNKFRYETIKRNSTSGFTLKWHVDDTVLVKIKPDSIFDPTDISIHDKYKLSRRAKDENLPCFSLVVYLSEHHVDFMGGEFEFVDETILPQKYMMIFFDSHEVHRVNQVRSGTRMALLYKWYCV